LGLKRPVFLNFGPVLLLARYWQLGSQSATSFTKTSEANHMSSGKTVFNHTTGILLAGTHSWANSAFDSLIARTLLPVANHPLIWYGLSWLHREGIGEVAVCGNRETRLLQARLSRHVPHGMTVSYHEDPMPRGAAGSARDAASATAAQTFVVTDGTAIPSVDLSELLLKHHTSGACVTVVVHSETRRYGQPVVNVPSGIYVFSRRALEAAPLHGFCDIKEGLIPQLYAAGERIVAFEAAAAIPRVLDASTYMAVNEWVVEQLVRDGVEDNGYVKSGSGLVHRDAFVAGDAALVGPVLVGPGARVMSGAVVVGPTSIGREATIACGAMVSRSAVWRRSTIGKDASADRCIVADDAVVDAGTQTLRGVVIADRSSDAGADWVEQQAFHVSKRPAFEVGARLGRLVFGASWSRSPAAQ
jgi:NDP-sugar pyrophosphorylase family protein